MRSASKLSRRELLRTAVTLTGLTTLFGLAGCRREEAFSCTSVAGLSPDEVRTRKLLGYVDRSMDLRKTCLRCALFVPSTSGGRCGACKIMKGPIHPHGYCTGFVPKV